MRYVCMRGEFMPALPKKAVAVFAGDHGVVEEGVSAFPKEVTRQMVLNFLAGGAGINVLARHAGAEVRVVDIGVDWDFGTVPGLLLKKVVRGTRNMAQEPAMTRQQAASCIMAGAEVARDLVSEGVGLLATGEMGIGNTTPASAVTAVLCATSPREVTGRGTGIGDEALARKVQGHRKGALPSPSGSGRSPRGPCLNRGSRDRRDLRFPPRGCVPACPSCG